MRELRLKAINMGVKQLLDREQMKTVMGGSSSMARGKCCPTSGGEGYGSGNVYCSDCVAGAVSCSLGVLVSC